MKIEGDSEQRKERVLAGKSEKECPERQAGPAHHRRGGMNPVLR